MGNDPVVKMAGISKSFLRVSANREIDFELYRGEICSILGENGAGKSTLMNILCGLYRPDKGKIFLKGKDVEINSPKEAIRMGIGMVHQHFNLVSTLQVWENIVLGKDRRFILNKGEACRSIAKISDSYGLKVDPEAFVWQLSVGEKQKVEIVKALFRGVEILILDEPTAVLTPQEAEALFSVLRNMVKGKISIIFISHKLKEVLNISDRIVVLRRGRVLGSKRTRETSAPELAALMVGSNESFKVKGKGRPPGSRIILKVEELSVPSDMGYEALKNISFTIHEGEILGLAGVSGNGQRELAEILNGIRKPAAGRVHYLDKPIPFVSPDALVRSGWARIPEDRMVQGVILNLDLTDNFLLENHCDSDFRYGPFVNYNKSKNFAKKLIELYDIRPPLPDVPVKTLSGGNIQKLILAREFSLQPRMVIVSQPTRGLDIKALTYIRNLLIDQREKGAAILLISEDLDEIFELSDRIAVIYEGEIVGIFSDKAADRIQVGLLMAGLAVDSTR